MFLSVVAVLATALFGSGYAQSSSNTASSTYSSSATGTHTSSVAGATHTCSVGADGFNFTPNQINASVGDVIEFRFYPQNHSVARAGYKNPCLPYEDTGPGLVGFWSGFEPVAVVLSDPPIFRLHINDTEPVFFYCSAPDACFQGMVGVINPNATFTFETQLSYALNATAEFSPGEYFPVEALPSTSTMVTTPTSTSAPATSTAAQTASSQSPSLSSGAIAGIAIGGVAVALLAGALIYMCGRQKSLGDILRQSQQPPPHLGHNSYVAGTPGMSEANYANMQKTGHVSVLSGGYSDQGYHGPGTETDSYRSPSPPVDERTSMMNVLMNNSQHASYLRNGQPSPGSPPSAPFPSPGYDTYAGTQPHEIDQSSGLIPTHLQRQNTVRHELPGAAPSPDIDSPRPFSFTESEAGYQPTDRRIDGLVPVTSPMKDASDNLP